MLGNRIITLRLEVNFATDSLVIKMTPFMKSRPILTSDNFNLAKKMKNCLLISLLLNKLHVIYSIPFKLFCKKLNLRLSVE